MNDDMKTSKGGLEFISKWEGCVLKPYKDIAGLRTIGIGHLIRPEENFPDGVAITKDQALELLAKDVAKCEVGIKKAITVPLNQNQFDALVSFGFNCGTGVYTTSGACKALNAGDLDGFCTKLLDWCKARINGQLTVNQGLLNRRKSEAQLFRKPVEVEVPVVQPPAQEGEFQLTDDQKVVLQSIITKSIQSSLESVLDSISDRVLCDDLDGPTCDPNRNNDS